MGKSLKDNIQELIDRGLLSVSKDIQGNLYGLVRDNLISRKNYTHIAYKRQKYKEFSS